MNKEVIFLIHINLYHLANNNEIGCHAVVSSGRKRHLIPCITYISLIDTLIFFNVAIIYKILINFYFQCQQLTFIQRNK